jgi:1,4-alpha-glucan branching enzyme
MTPLPRHDYYLPLPAGGVWKEIVNSDAVQYGGSGVGNMGTVTAKNGGAALMLPPLATIMLEFVG